MNSTHEVIKEEGRIFNTDKSILESTSVAFESKWKEFPCELNIEENQAS